MMEELPEKVELTDPRALRALAHPTRMKLVGLLRQQGAMTATQAGERIGESAASCSFHLRQLARWGLVEEAGGGHGRERPWRATARTTSWKITAPELAEPAAALSSLVVRGQFDIVLEAVERLPTESPEWQGAAQLTDTVIYLTPAQLELLGKQIWELITPWEHVRPEPSARPVDLFFAAFPKAVDGR